MSAYAREQIDQYVRRFKRTQFIKAVANIGCDAVGMSAGLMKNSHIYPWTLVDMADISLCKGNEHRDREVSFRDIQKISNMIMNCTNIARAVLKNDPGRMLAAMSYQQFPLQQNTMVVDILRILTLFDSAYDSGFELFQEEEDVAKLFGANILDVTLAISWLEAIFTTGHGIVPEKNIIEGSEIHDTLLPGVNYDTLLSVLNMLTCDIDDYRDRADVTPTLVGAAIDGARYTPLNSTPIIKIKDRYVAPVAGLISRTICPHNLFYRGMQLSRTQEYSNDMGHLFEVYVGKQLKAIPKCRVHEKIPYQENKEAYESVDWFLETPSFLYLIEAKAGIMTLGGRHGTLDFLERVETVINKGYDQIEVTCEKIKQRGALFSHLPTKENRGIVVTLDEYFAPGFYTSKGSTKSTIMSIQTLENIVSYTQTEDADMVLDEFFERGLLEVQPGSTRDQTKYDSNPVFTTPLSKHKERLAIVLAEE